MATLGVPRVRLQVTSSPNSFSWIRARPFPFERIPGPCGPRLEQLRLSTPVRKAPPVAANQIRLGLRIEEAR